MKKLTGEIGDVLNRELRRCGHHARDDTPLKKVGVWIIKADGMVKVFQPSCPSNWMCRRSKRRTTMAKRETTTTMLTMTAGITMSENQAADSGGTMVMRCDDPPCEGPSLADNKV